MTTTTLWRRLLGSCVAPAPDSLHSPPLTDRSAKPQTSSGARCGATPGSCAPCPCPQHPNTSAKQPSSATGAEVNATTAPLGAASAQAHAQQQPSWPTTSPSGRTVPLTTTSTSRTATTTAIVTPSAVGGSSISSSACVASSAGASSSGGRGAGGVRVKREESCAGGVDDDSCCGSSVDTAEGKALARSSATTGSGASFAFSSDECPTSPGVHSSGASAASSAKPCFSGPSDCSSTARTRPSLLSHQGAPTAEPGPLATARLLVQQLQPQPARACHASPAAAAPADGSETGGEPWVEGLAGCAPRAHSDPWRASALGCGSHPANALGGAGGHDTQPVQDLDLGAMLVSPRGSSGSGNDSGTGSGSSRRPSPLSSGSVAPPCGVPGGVSAGGPGAKRGKSSKRFAAAATSGMVLGPLERRGRSSDCSSGGGGSGSGPLDADWLHVALSAYQSREIAQGDPSVHVRHLKPVSCGQGTVVYRGVWQGIMVAIKFCLLRRETHQHLLQQHQQPLQDEHQHLQDHQQQQAGHEARAFHRELSRLVASLCAPNGSCLARTYAADMSEVVLASLPPSTGAPDPGSPGAAATAAAAVAQVPRLPSRYGNGPMLALRPFDDDGVADELGSLIWHGSATDIPSGQSGTACTSALCSVTRSASDASASTSASTSTTLPCAAPTGRFPSTAAASQTRLHFSSVVFGAERPQPPSLLSPLSGPSVLSPPNSFCSNGARGSTDSSTGSRTAPSPASILDGTLQGLLFHLGARPGDYLVHSVMELASGGNLWHAMSAGAFAMHGVGLYTLLRSARSVARGLYQLHTVGHVHGGLTPSNVLLTWGGGVGSSADDSGASGRRRGFTAHVADFGMRRLVLGDARWQWQLGSNGELLRCTAPELLAAAMGAVASCAREAGLAGPSGTIARLGRGPPLEWQLAHDIYSFGAILHAMCTGMLPYAHLPSASEVLAAQQGGPAKPAWPPHVWLPLRNLGEACMCRDPRVRPAVGDIVHQLWQWEQRVRGSGSSSSRSHRTHGTQVSLHGMRMSVPGGMFTHVGLHAGRGKGSAAAAAAAAAVASVAGMGVGMGYGLRLGTSGTTPHALGTVVEQEAETRSAGSTVEACPVSEEGQGLVVRVGPCRPSRAPSLSTLHEQL